MDLVHRWPIFILAAASAACIMLLLWILFNFLRESHRTKDGSPGKGARSPRL